MLKQKFLIQFGSNISLRIFGLMAGIVVARVAGPEVVGTIAYATAYVSIFGFITGLFGPAHIKLISEGQNLGDCIATYTKLQLISIVVFTLAVLGWFLFSTLVLHNSFDSKIQEQVILIILFAIVFQKLINFNEVSFTGLLKQAKANYPMLLRGIIFQIGRVVVVLLGFRAIGLASWNLITAILLIPIAYKLFKTLPFEKFDNNLSKKYFGYAVPVFLLVVITSIVTYSDKLILYHFTNATELGYYSAAFSIGGIILIVGRTIGTIFFPLFSSLIEKNDWEAVNSRILTFETFVVTFIFPFACLMALISEPLITTILGSKYEPSIRPFGILIFASYVTIVGMPYGNVLTGMGRFYLGVWLNVAKFLVYISGVYFFISPDFLGLGATGLAINLLLVNIVHNILFFIFSKRIGEIKVGYSNFLRYLIIITISIGFYYGSTMFLPMNNLWWFVLCLLFIFLQYGILLFAGLLKAEQIRELFGLLKLRTTFRYFKNELNE